MQRQKDFGGFLGAPFELIGQNIQAVALYVLVVGGLTAAGIGFGLLSASDTVAGMSMGFVIEEGMSLASSAYELVVAVASIIAAYFLIAQMLRGQGRLQSTETRIWAYVGMSILSIIGLIIGFVLLIIPGLILMVRWSASSGFLIGDRVGVVDSLKASWDATSGYSWEIFFAGLVLLLAMTIGFGILGAVVGFSGSELAIGILSAIAESITNAVFLAFGVGIYCLVQDNAEQTADVFA